MAAETLKLRVILITIIVDCSEALNMVCVLIVSVRTCTCPCCGESLGNVCSRGIAALGIWNVTHVHQVHTDTDSDYKDTYIHWTTACTRKLALYKYLSVL